MKKLILSAAIILGSLSMHATTTTNTDAVKIAINFQNEYKEVNVDAVPAVVKTALETAYPGAKLGKAYVNEKKEYKLEISVGDQKATVYSDVNGNWLKI
jgi:ribosomal protein L21E